MFLTHRLSNYWMNRFMPIIWRGSDTHTHTTPHTPLHPCIFFFYLNHIHIYVSKKNAVLNFILMVLSYIFIANFNQKLLKLFFKCSPEIVGRINICRMSFYTSVSIIIWTLWTTVNHKDYNVYSYNLVNLFSVTIPRLSSFPPLSMYSISAPQTWKKSKWLN